MNIRKHWKNFLLTTAALFWASCDDSTSTEAQCLYGTPPEYQSSNSNVTPSSSNETPASSSSETAKPESSSSELASSSETQHSSSSEAASSNSINEVSCHPGDSVIGYFPLDYSVEHAKANAAERARYEALDSVEKIIDPRPISEKEDNPLDSVAWSKIPQCLKDIRDSLSYFVALYGAPIHIHTDEVCDDGTTHPTEEYLNYQKMKEDWERNKPALDEEVKKIYEDKLKELEQQINRCLNEARDQSQASKS